MTALSILSQAHPAQPPRSEFLALVSAEEPYKNMLDTLGLVAITVRAGGRVLQVNRTGKAILGRADGLYVRNGLIACRNDAMARTLARAIAAATAPHAREAGALLLERPSQLPPYQITVTPLGTKAGTRTALIVFRDPDARDPSLPQRLRSLFGLTAAEAELAVALAQGDSLAEIATRRQVRESTIRSQMKSIATKMHCNRQAEIAAIVARLPPLIETRD